MLSVPGPGELRSHKPRGVATKKERRKNDNHWSERGSGRAEELVFNRRDISSVGEREREERWVQKLARARLRSGREPRSSYVSGCIFFVK